MNAHLADTLTALRAAGVGEAVIARVERLNQNRQPGERLRGIHFSTDELREMFWRCGALQKGKFIIVYGRERYAGLSRDDLIKCGRRVYVRQSAMHRRS